MVPCFASWSAISLPSWPLWPGSQMMVTLLRLASVDYALCVSMAVLLLIWTVWIEDNSLIIYSKIVSSDS